MFKFFKKIQDKKLAKDFAAAKRKFATQNYKRLMTERLIPYFRDLELSSTGLLKSDADLFKEAHSFFLRAKQEGRLDELNQIVDMEETNYGRN